MNFEKLIKKYDNKTSFFIPTHYMQTQMITIKILVALKKRIWIISKNSI